MVIESITQLGLSVFVGWGCVDGGYMPLPTHPKQYCEPASLVFDKKSFVYTLEVENEKSMKSFFSFLQSNPTLMDTLVKVESC